MTEWQPIETAPKDGTTVLLFIPGYMRKVWIGSYDVTEHFLNGMRRYRSEGWRTDGFDLPGKPPTPTHWMPLPSAPN